MEDKWNVNDEDDVNERNSKETGYKMNSPHIFASENGFNKPKIPVPVRGYESNSIHALNMIPPSIISPQIPPNRSNQPLINTKSQNGPNLFGSAPINYNELNYKNSPSPPKLIKDSPQSSPENVNIYETKIQIPKKEYNTTPDLQNVFSGSQPLRASGINQFGNSRNSRSKSPLSFTKVNQPSGPVPSRRQNAPVINREVSKELQLKIRELSQAFPDFDQDEIGRIVIENQGYNEEYLLGKILELKILNPPINEFTLDTYKIFKCQLGLDCADSSCVYFHSICEKRRVPIIYRPVMCDAYPNCIKGDTCDKAHSLNEIYYHTDNIYKEQCPFKKCVLGKACIYLHDARHQSQTLVEKLKLQAELCGSAQQEFRLKLKDLEEKEKLLMYEKARIEALVTCNECKKYRIGVVRVPCGHYVCYACDQVKVCPICRAVSSCIKIEYNYTE